MGDNVLSNARLICGSSYPEFCKEVSDITNIKMVECEMQYFSNGEIRPVIKESIRGKEVIIFQTGTFSKIKVNRSINDYIMELFFLVKTSLGSLCFLHLFIHFIYFYSLLNLRCVNHGIENQLESV